MHKKDEIIMVSLKKLAPEKKELIMKSIITVLKMGKNDLNEGDVLFKKYLEDLGLSFDEFDIIDSEFQKSPKNPEEIVNILNELSSPQKKWLVVNMNFCAGDDEKSLMFTAALAANIGINKDEYNKMIDEAAKQIFSQLMDTTK